MTGTLVKFPPRLRPVDPAVKAAGVPAMIVILPSVRIENHPHREPRFRRRRRALPSVFPPS